MSLECKGSKTMNERRRAKENLSKRKKERKRWDQICWDEREDRVNQINGKKKRQWYQPPTRTRIETWNGERRKGGRRKRRDRERQDRRKQNKRNERKKTIWLPCSTDMGKEGTVNKRKREKAQRIRTRQRERHTISTQNQLIPGNSERHIKAEKGRRVMMGFRNERNKAGSSRFIWPWRISRNEAECSRSNG